jgi:DNA-binding LacI/PurR family transcriptional regulator
MMALLNARYNHWQQLRRLKIPVVDLAESRPNIKLSRVTMDNMAIGRIAAEHFLESVYRHFAVYHRWELGVSRRRCDAFKSIVNAAGHGCEAIPRAFPRSGFAPGYDEYGTWPICEHGPWPICIALVARVTGESHSDKEQK